MTLGRSLLTAFLAERDIKRSDFASRVGVTRPLVTMWLSTSPNLKKRRTPGRKSAFEIERVTEGAVPARSWDEECPTSKGRRKSSRGRRAA